MSLSLAVAALVLTGAGCFGGKETTTVSSGGMWRSPNGGESWVETNTLLLAPENGSIAVADILAIERDPQDASAVYLATRGSGIMMSRDGGTSWSRPNEAIVRDGTVLDVEVDPKDICTLYVLKADRVVRSTTCGRTWEAERYLETQPGVTLTALALDWYNAGTVYVGNSEGAIVKSTDGGATWARLNDMRYPISAIEVSNADSRVVLAATSRKGLYRTADGGLTWENLEESFEKFREADRVSHISQSADGKMIAIATEYGIFRSTDVGATWAPLPLVSAAGDVTITALAVAPRHNDVIYYGTSDSIVQTLNGGATWTVAGSPTTRAISAILVDDIDPEQIQVGLKNLEK